MGNPGHIKSQLRLLIRDKYRLRMDESTFVFEIVGTHVVQEIDPCSNGVG